MENYTSSMNLCPSCIIKIKLYLSRAWEWERQRYEEVQCALNCSPYIYRHKLIIYLQTFKVSFTPSTIKWVGIPFSSLHTYCIGYSSTDCLLHSCLLYIYGISFAVCFRIPRNIPHTKSLLLLLSCFRTHVNFADNEVPQK